MFCGVVRHGVMLCLPVCCRYDAVDEEERCATDLLHVLRQCILQSTANVLCVMPLPLPSSTVAPIEYTKVVLPQKMLKLLISDYEVACLLSSKGHLMQHVLMVSGASLTPSSTAYTSIADVLLTYIQKRMRYPLQAAGPDKR